MTERETLEAGTFYHIYQRGNNSGKLFLENRNYPYFLKLLRKHLEPIAQVYAYCLLSNHFHLLLRIHDQEALPKAYQTVERKLHQPFSNWLNAYSKAINKAYNRTGHLLEARFRRHAVHDEFYLINLVYYIHANPQKHGFLKDFRHYPLSSFSALSSEGPTWLQREQVWNWFGGKEGFIKYHSDYHAFLAEQDWEK